METPPTPAPSKAWGVSMALPRTELLCTPTYWHPLKVHGQTKGESCHLILHDSSVPEMLKAGPECPESGGPPIPRPSELPWSPGWGYCDGLEDLLRLSRALSTQMGRQSQF